MTKINFKEIEKFYLNQLVHPTIQYSQSDVPEEINGWCDLIPSHLSDDEMRGIIKLCRCLDY